MNTALNLSFIAGLATGSLMCVLFALGVSPPTIAIMLALAAVAASALWGADVYAEREIRDLSRGVVRDRLHPRTAPASLDCNGVEQRGRERSQGARHDAEARALGLPHGDEDDDADERRERENGDDDDAQKVG